MVATKMRGNILHRADGSTISFPPDNVFAPKDPGAVDINLESSPSVQAFTKGTRLEDVWGRVFRYVEFGATIIQNALLQAEAPDANHDDLDIVAAVAGDTSIVTTTTQSVLVNEYAGGWVYSELLVSGLAYPISDHAAFSSAAMTFNLFVAIQTAMVADADISLVKSPYSEVIIAPHSTMTGKLLGGNCANGATDGDFGWVQTRGPGKLLGETTVGVLVVGGMCTLSTTVDGSIDGYIEDGTEDLPIVGQIMNVLDGTEYNLVDIALE